MTMMSHDQGTALAEGRMSHCLKDGRTTARLFDCRNRWVELLIDELVAAWEEMHEQLASLPVAPDPDDDAHLRLTGISG